MEEPILDDYEKELVRFCDQRFFAGKEDVVLEEVPGYSADTKKKNLDALNGLISAGAISKLADGIFRVEPKCVEIRKRLDNPPPIDRWDEATKWLRSKRWTLPLLVVGVALPLIKGYWDLISLILGYIYPASRKP
jgi:hypothetical protein